MKRFVLFTNVISPHQLPLAKELAAQVGEGNFRYIYTESADKDHGGLGWSLDVPDWCINVSDKDADEWLETADTLLSGLRCFNLFERRAKKDLKNFYMTERWFKPPIGILRLLHPRYLGYARRLCRLLESGAVTGLPIGIHAARDMARLCGFVHGKISCLFNAPELDFERKPGGRIYLASSTLQLPATATLKSKRYCLDKMRMWGYFVEPTKSKEPSNAQLTTNDYTLTTKKVLWVGRLLNLKRVDTIIRAVGEISRSPFPVPRSPITLDIYGTGPEEKRLKKVAAKYGDCIRFNPPVPITEVRKLMREHDVYVLSSNGYEGWGAVVSEALEEWMPVLGSYEAGACATMLPDANLFHAGDWKRLAQLLKDEISPVAIGDWTAKSASNNILNEEKKIQQHV